MDHFSKALERAQVERTSVRDWVLPSSESPAADPTEADMRSVVLSPSHLKERHVLCGLGVEDPVMSDVYRLLRTRVTQIMRQNDWSTVGITSAEPRAGKTLTSINLSIIMARDSTSGVVLVDADLRRPSIAETLGLSAGVGLIDCLASDTAMNDALVRPNIDNLIVLQGRPDESGKAVPELLTSPRMTALMRSLRRRDKTGFVVVDLPPVLMGDDVLAVAPLLDCLLVVVDEGKTQVEELREAANLLKNFNVLGTVLNRSAKRKSHSEGYYYQATAVAK